MIRHVIRNMRRIAPFLAMLCLILLPACTGLQSSFQSTVRDGDTQDEIVAATSFVVADLKEAKASADAWGDVSASMCWGKLIDYAEAFPAKTQSKVIGAAGAYQRARNARRLYDAGIPEDVHIACAPMISDARSTLLRLAKLAGGLGLPIP